MPEAFGEIESAPGVVVQPHCLPAAESGGADPQVDGYVEDGTAYAGHVFP
jgi:hypothetical protein